MNIKQFLRILLTISYTFLSPSYVYSMPGGAAPFNQNMSEEEMLSKMMEEINAAIPEDQREAFWKEVEQETQRLEQATAHMSDEEKQAYLLNQMNAAMEEAAPIQAPEPVIEKKVKEEKPKPKPAQIKEAVETSEILKSIIRSINLFINKAAAFPDFDRKVESWSKQNLLSDWPAGQTWELFKNELNKLNSLLQRFQEKDPKIGMKHIDALAKNEQAIQTLKQLEAKLAREVPIIDVSVFAITSMSKQTKNAIAHTMNALTESIYKIKLGESLQKIIEEFDPAAKKLRAEEEKAAKSALTQTQRQPSQVSVRTAGKPERKNDFFLPSLDDAGISGYRGDSGYTGGSGRGGYDDYNRDATTDGAQKKTGAAGSTGGSAGKSATGDKSDAKKPDDKKPDPATKGKPVETNTTIKDPIVKGHVDNFGRDLKEASDAILSTAELQGDLKAYISKDPSAPAA